MRVYRRRYRPVPRRRTQRSTSRLRALGRQLGISLLVLAVVAGLSALPGRWTGGALGWVRAAISWEFDLSAALRTLSNRLGQRGELGLDRLRRFWEGSALPAPGSMTWPAGGPVVAAFGWRTVPAGGQTLADGIDIAAPAGSPVRAALGGTVLSVRSSPVYGLVIEVDHGNGLTSLYGRCDHARVAPKQRVDKGQVMAEVAADGPGRPALYFEVRLSGQAVDPLRWLPAEPTP